MGPTGSDQSWVSDFDFFGAPTTPPPSGPPSASQFGTPTTSQFGTPPTTNQFGSPAAAPVRPVGPPPGAQPPSENRGQLLKLAGVVAAVVLALGGWLWINAQGKKAATKVTTTVELPIVKAHQTAETADLQQAGTAQEAYQAEHSSYATASTQLVGFMASPGDVLTVVSAGATAYCMRVDDTSNFHAPSMYLTSTRSGASTTPCS